MADKVIVRSAVIDRHGDFIPLRMMEEYVVTVNGTQKMRYLANHRRDIPPIGYFDNAEIQKIDNVHHTLVEPIIFGNRVTVPWDDTLLIEDAGKAVCFIMRNDQEADDLRISIDKNNFKSITVLNKTSHELEELFDEPISVELNMRKHLLPDPQVVITLTEYALVLYPLLKPFLSKIGEKIAEDIAEDLYEACKSKAKGLVRKLTDSVRLIRSRMVPEDRVLLTIFEIPGDPYIELHIKSDDPTKIEKGLNARNLMRVHQKIIDFQSRLDISEVYFVLNAKDKWTFSYLITQDGKIIGTTASFKKRDKLVTRINLSPTKAFSVGADGVKYEERQILPVPQER